MRSDEPWVFHTVDTITIARADGDCAQAAERSSYIVYLRRQCSYLGFGLMAARAATLDWAETAVANPCVPLDHSGMFEYGGKQHNLVATKEGYALLQRPQAPFDAAVTLQSGQGQ